MAIADAPVLVCDLDGTILQVNSFPVWISHLVAGRLPWLGWRDRALLSFRVQRLLVYRKSGRLDHRQLMGEIQRAWHAAAPADEAALAPLRARLLRRVRPSLRPVLRAIAAGETEAVLATAAAGEYAILLGRELGFRHVLTTPARLTEAGTLNAGARKLRRVREFLASACWLERPLILLTDHLDDLPLIRHCGAVAWFGSPAMMARASELAVGTRLIDCHELDAEATSRALSVLAASARSSAQSAAGSSAGCPNGGRRS